MCFIVAFFSCFWTGVLARSHVSRVKLLYAIIFPRAQAGLCSVLFSFTVSLSAGIGNLAVISNDPTMKDGRHYLELGAGNFEQYFTIDGIWSIMHYSDHYYG